MRAVLRSEIGQSAAATRERGERLATPLLLGGMFAVALLVRLLFIGADGFKGDVGTFESWSLTLADHPIRDFYTTTGFADYPPGYFFVLWAIGHVYRAIVHVDPSYSLLKIFVKLPAIVMDIVDAGLVFVIVRRFASSAWAFAAAALLAFNPALIFISAYWGQVDSVAAGFTLVSLALVLESERRTGRAAGLALVAAWLVLAYSILIKPPSIVLAPIYIAFVYASSEASVRITRALATVAGVAGAFALAYVAALAFHAGWNPIAQFAWLYERYHYASNVYPYNSVNAFNLYVMAGHSFWQPDSTIVPNWTIGGHVVGLPQYEWGVGLLVAAILLVVSRLVQRRDAVAVLEAAAIVSLGYFVLSTRMHERYIFNGLLLAVPLVWYRRRYLFAVGILTVTLFANLAYSLDYLYVMDAKTPNVDAANLMPFLSRTCSLLNVGTFFYLGYAFLGATKLDAFDRFSIARAATSARERVRSWFAPLEGVAWMTPVDWAVAGAMTVGAFVLTFVGYVWPSEKIFDEIYYARAGEEYLQHKEIFEFTHPPLTKLVVTASMMLFGGMHGGGDTAAGWRFLDLVVGALMVLVMYCFAKRLFGSTPWAAVASGMLVFDGFRFAQARIATPEITVGFFTLLVLYAFYRYWIASQIRVAPDVDVRLVRAEAIAIVASLALDAGLTATLVRGQSFAAHAVLFLYLGCGAYALVRLALPRFVKTRAIVSYAEGSYVSAKVLHTSDDGRVTIGASAAAPAHRDGELEIRYGADGAVAYVTPDGTATYEPTGLMRAGAATIDGRRDGLVWLGLLALAAGCLGASKWNGLFDFFVVWFFALAVAGQAVYAPILRTLGIAVKSRPATWGNPLGFSFDIVVTTMLFVGGTIYALCYLPFFGLGHDLADLVGLQQQMYVYHHDTVAKATHPYSSKWWQWPILQIPISYYYHDFRTGAAASNGAACCVAEVMALPNPITWWLGLVSVPLMGWFAWREKHKGYALLFVAYFIQWMPWILSPRITFEYHFFPNLAIVLLADTMLLKKVWDLGGANVRRWTWPRYAVSSYLALAFAAFVFWYPVVAGTHVTYDAWNARMLTWLENNNWINPHPGQ